MGKAAKVAIGLPVYNGENYLSAALQSLRDQTFGDFEVQISDNASTDATANICHEFARRDKRFIYHRQPENIGAVANYERVFRLCRSEYFKWAAHDDVCAPRFLELCNRVLDENPDAVLAYPRAQVIGPRAEFLREYNVKLETDSPDAATRFAAVACADHKTTSNFEIFGLMRRSAVELIPQQGGYAASDRVFLARLALCGRFVEVPEVLFLSRDHPHQSIKTLPEHLRKNRSWLSRLIGSGQLPPAEWFDPKHRGRITFPEWRLAWEYVTSMRYGHLPAGQRARVMVAVMNRQFSHGNWLRMARDFVMIFDQLGTRLVQAIAPPRPDVESSEASDAPSVASAALDSAIKRAKPDSKSAA